MTKNNRDDETIGIADELTPIVKRINAAVAYSGNNDHEDVRSILTTLLTQTKQETIQECIDALPEKEYRFNDMDICFCGTVLEVDDSDFPRRVSHQDCPAIKAIDTAHKALTELKEQE